MTATSQHTARVELTVGQVAESFGVTVRTLHHYDAEGLVVPSARTHAGYRLYTDADLARLATVVTYRRLGLPLTEVRALLDGEGSAEEHLRRQRDAVVSRLGELEQLVTAIDRALEREMEQRPATTEELKELFGDGFSEEYQAEAQERWGETDAWKQSSRRTKRYTKADWADQGRGGCRQRRPRRRAAVGCARHVHRGDGCRRGAPRAHRAVVLRPRPRLPPGPGRHVPRRPAVHEDLRGPGTRASRSTCTTRSTPTPTGTSRPDAPAERPREESNTHAPAAGMRRVPTLDACSGVREVLRPRVDSRCPSHGTHGVSTAPRRTPGTAPRGSEDPSERAAASPSPPPAVQRRRGRAEPSTCARTCSPPTRRPLLNLSDTLSSRKDLTMRRLLIALARRDRRRRPGASSACSATPRSPSGCRCTRPRATASSSAPESPTPTPEPHGVRAGRRPRRRPPGGRLRRRARRRPRR